MTRPTRPCDKAGCDAAATVAVDRLNLCANHAEEYKAVVPWFLRERAS